jgi:hypothetical protein
MFSVPDSPVTPSPINKAMHPKFREYVPDSFPYEEMKLVLSRCHFDHAIRDHIVRSITFLSLHGLFEDEISHFAENEDPKIVQPSRLAFLQHKKLREHIQDWQNAVPDNKEDLEVEPVRHASLLDRRRCEKLSL